MQEIDLRVMRKHDINKVRGERQTFKAQEATMPGPMRQEEQRVHFRSLNRRQ